MRWYYLVTPETVARFDYDDPAVPDAEWPAPGLLLELVCAGCPITDLGSNDLDEVIEIHPEDDRLLVVTNPDHGRDQPPAVELAEPVRALLLPWLA